MAPAPDEYPDFDNMTPEEQMAWLESLARRQGANADEFLTAADQDIPIPENAVIDEPGYVPYSISQGGRMERSEKPAPEPDKSEELRAGEQGVEPPALEEGAFEEEATDNFPPVLEDVEFQADAFGVAAELNNPERPSETGLADLEEDAGAEAPSDAELADPMTWLDSLSAHPEGADADFLAEIGRAAGTAGDLDLGWLEQDRGSDADNLPYDRQQPLDFGSLEDLDLEGFGELDLEEILAQAGMSGETEPTAAEPEGPVAQDESALHRAASEAVAPDSGEESEAETEAEWDEEDVLGGADPMKWLETLARRQGAKPEELTTEADLEIPELPEDTVVDEPGYTEYSPFGILPPRREEAARAEAASFEAEGGAAAEPELEAELDLLAQSLGWLSDMTSEPPGPMSTWLAVEDTFVDQKLRADEELVEATEAGHGVPGDAQNPLAGMTEEEIEQALRRGELTAAQELAWLRQTAQERVEGLEEDLSAEEPEEVEPAEITELPPWLQQMRDADAAEEVAKLEADTAAWLEEQAEEAVSGGEPHPSMLDSMGITETELAAFLEGDTGVGESSAVAEALGEVSLPEQPLSEAAPVEMPDWLVETEEEIGADAQLPAWLTEMEQGRETSLEEIPDWLSELRAEEAEIQREPGEEPVAEEAVTLPPEPEVSAPARAPEIPESELFASYRQRLQEEPGDYASRLALARTLRMHGEVAPSLDHYETLVENSKLLDDVADDLARLVDEQPMLPRARRLLGDSLMRRGRLQDAIDAYRAALERL